MKARFCSYFLICSFVSCLFLCGCSTIKEAAKEVIGVSTKDAEASREGAIKKQFDYSYNDCNNYALEILKRNDIYVYAQVPEKNLIAVYVSSGDTTPVGVFLNTIEANRTEVEVGSPSTYAKEYVAEKLFAGLAKINQPQDTQIQDKQATQAQP